MLKLADNFAAFNERLKYAHYRPSVPVNINPGSWWKYAFNVVSDRMKRARYWTPIFLPSFACGQASLCCGINIALGNLLLLFAVQASLVLECCSY